MIKTIHMIEGQCAQLSLLDAQADLIQCGVVIADVPECRSCGKTALLDSDRCCVECTEKLKKE